MGNSRLGRPRLFGSGAGLGPKPAEAGKAETTTQHAPSPPSRASGAM